MIIKKIRPKFHLFDYVYMVVMIIYMAQATEATSRMIGGLSGNPIPLLLPMLLTGWLCYKHPINLLDRRLLAVVTIYLVWAALSLYKYGIYTITEFSYHFFMLYAIVVAFIQNQVYGYRFVDLYDTVFVWFCKISILFWLISLAFPNFGSIFDFLSIQASTNIRECILYIFTWNNPEYCDFATRIRNSGCSWEPGRFAIMVTLAIFCNLCRYGIRFRRNSNIWWYLFAIASTMSTTGYIATVALYVIFIFNRHNLKTVFAFLFIVVPGIILLMQLDFMGDKLMDRINNAQDVSRHEQSFYWSEQLNARDEYRGSIDRIDAMVFESMNIRNDPWLGHGRNNKHSYFYNHITTNYVLANGLLKIFANYGLIFGLFCFFILYRSSVKIGNDSHSHKRWALFIVLTLSAVSYQILSIPVFTTFWFYGIFSTKVKIVSLKRTVKYQLKS